MLSLAFSVNVSADTLSFDRLAVEDRFYYGTEEFVIHWIDNAFDHIEENSPYEHVCELKNITATAQPYYKSQIAITHSDSSSVIFKKGTTHQVLINGLKYAGTFQSAGGDYYRMAFDKSQMSMYIRYRYVDGSFSNYYQIPADDVTMKEISSEVYKLYLNTSITCENDVNSVYFILKWYNLSFLSNGPNYIYQGRVWFELDELQVETEQTDPKVGLLEKVVNYCRDMLNNIGTGFNNVLNSLTQLPNQIGIAISNIIRNLFVPPPDDITAFKNSLDELLSSKLGAVYQVGDIVKNSWEQIQNSDSTNTVNMPSVSLQSVGIPFSFGGYDVEIVPAKMSVIVEVLKKIISILATCLFVNGLLKRYDEVMGVE